MEHIKQQKVIWLKCSKTYNNKKKNQFHINKNIQIEMKKLPKKELKSLKEIKICHPKYLLPALIQT